MSKRAATPVRFDPPVADRLASFVAANPGMSLSSAANRLVDEALRMSEHPGIVFRSGPTGRRAGLVGGPDVWEIVRDLKAAAREGATDPIEAVAAGTGLDRRRIELAAAYYAAYPDDVDDRIRLSEEAAERLRRALGITPVA